MRRQLIGFVIALSAIAAASVWAALAQGPSNDGPRYDANRDLLLPADYREWVYVTTGLGMTYGPAGGNGGPARFDNVFVNRDSYRRFLTTGRWPDKTMFVLEIRQAEQNVSINNGGNTQGAVLAVEATVKDAERFPDTTWGYFSFDRSGGVASSASPLPTTATCYSCHRTNAAVENTFVQFYPTLMDVARRMGTVKPTYDPQHTP